MNGGADTDGVRYCLLSCAVGSGSLKLRNAIIIGCVMEFAGLVFFGSSMFNTMRTGT